MTVGIMINELQTNYPEIIKFNLFYYEDLGEDFLEEFTGVSSYHDNYLDTSEDPDGWTLNDKVKSYYVYDKQEENEDNELNIHVYLE